jgi:2',3'-cyclic-nucleotide 2'-phosphodiesterase (5'-nucleotidase family)
VPWAVLGLAALTLVVLATAGPGGFLTFFARLGRAPQGPLNLTIVHTNDTWGFVFPSG